ncbi:class II fructose-bisphosphate aldolase [Curtobacterium sp. VKM Ac-2922]|uniref:class II fructose-bisphosphate aldolase n=1 Tax=Curtobacterium sp. VKM Ac-2922 TaxID=2929475 RepID=UPI001FB5515F|nr:class II fructose-bisphosphate aldolase [Curtobacterium sp. VKM Ac-2922]MCJ1715135.1 class II fructose-bisphosphate aldolase [Curtobacterium sp. VKM Ac-2922]
MDVSTRAMTRTARDDGYAVPAVNVFDELSMRAVIAAATRTQAPLIVQISVKTVRSSGTAFTTDLFRALTRDVTVPVALHLDHCPDRAVLDDVIAAGWSSVLFDASDRDLDDAVRETGEVTAAAHAAGVDVESEIENILGVEDGVGSDASRHAYSVEQLADVAARTDADLVAPQLGTSHGLYKADPVLLPERAAGLAALTDRPIVLHGGTGLSAADFRSFIDAGVSKINISTAVKHAYMRASLAHLEQARASDSWDPPKLVTAIESAVTDVIAEHVTWFGADGRAGRR